MKEYLDRDQDRDGCFVTSFPRGALRISYYENPSWRMGRRHGTESIGMRGLSFQDFCCGVMGWDGVCLFQELRLKLCDGV